MLKYPSIQVPKCSNTQMPKCPNAQMSTYASVQVPITSNIQLPNNHTTQIPLRQSQNPSHSKTSQPQTPHIQSTYRKLPTSESKVHHVPQSPAIPQQRRPTSRTGWILFIVPRIARLVCSNASVKVSPVADVIMWQDTADECSGV